MIKLFSKLLQVLEKLSFEFPIGSLISDTERLFQMLDLCPNCNYDSFCGIVSSIQELSANNRPTGIRV